VTSNFKERETKNQPERHSFLTPPPDPHLCIFRLASRSNLPFGVSSVPSGVPLCASAPPVRGYLRFDAGTRKGFFSER